MLNSPYHNTPSYLHPKDIAERFNKSIRWVYDHAGDLNGFRIGRSVFFTERGIEDAIQGGKILESKGAISGEAVHQKIGDKESGNRLGEGKVEGTEKLRNAAKRHGLAEFL